MPYLQTQSIRWGRGLGRVLAKALLSFHRLFPGDMRKRILNKGSKGLVDLGPKKGRKVENPFAGFNPLERE